MKKHRVRARALESVNCTTEQFLRFVDKTPTCWIWNASVNAQGYGEFRNLRAHRVSYVLFKGPIPFGLYVRHECDNPPCVNPDHLVLGSPQDNSNDAAKHGLMQSRWSPDDIAEMKRLRGAGMPMIRISHIFDISPCNVSAFVSGKIVPLAHRLGTHKPRWDAYVPTSGPCKACHGSGSYPFGGFRKRLVCVDCEGTGNYIPGGRKKEVAHV